MSVRDDEEVETMVIRKHLNLRGALCGLAILAVLVTGAAALAQGLMPLGAMDVAPYITRIQNKAQDLDAVVGILWGPSGPQWVKAWSEYGLKGKLPLLTLGETVNETYLRSATPRWAS